MKKETVNNQKKKWKQKRINNTLILIKMDCVSKFVIDFIDK